MNGPVLSLAAAAYLQDFYERYEHAAAAVRKWECSQSFREPGNPSWEALERGDTEEAFANADYMDDSTRDFYEAAAARGVIFRRVRLASLPLTDYLRWEFTVLRARLDAGENVRVAAVPVEPASERRELVSVDESVLYEVLYSDEGDLEGARVHLDPAECRTFNAFFDRNYAASLDLREFDDRRGPLPQLPVTSWQ